jgi:hypothetical protein
MPIDYTNNQQVEDAIMQHISSALASWEIADVSTDDRICSRIHDHYRRSVHDRRPPGSNDAVRAALGRLYAAGRLWSRRHMMFDGTYQMWYGLPPTTDEQRTAWAAFDRKLAERHAALQASIAAVRSEQEEPAAEEGDE